MRVVVLGAGVVGVTTAYYLTEQGHSVTLVDRGTEPASGASGANGGQLSWSFTDAQANPAMLCKMPGFLAGADPSVRMYLSPGVSRWGLGFLRECSRQKARQNTVAVLDLATRSSRLLRELMDNVELDFSYRRAGKMVLLREQADMAWGHDSRALKHENGCETEVLPFEKALEIEPALEGLSGSFRGVLYSANDDVGDAQAFSNGLADWLKHQRNIDFKLETEIDRITVRSGRVIGVDTDQGELTADAVVVCMGAWSTDILSPLGIRLPIYPVRGYSVTLPPTPNSNRVSITDPKAKIVFSRMGERLRIAGFTDFNDFRTNRDQVRVETLLDQAKSVAPRIADYDHEAKAPWGGFRPLTPNSQPITGPTRIGGLFLNTGHGSLGWTLACATGHQVAAQI